MRILIINTVRFRLNGMTSVILNYYRNMDKSNMQIDFVVPNDISTEYRKELEKNHSNIYCIPRNSNPIKYQWRLYKVMKKNHYDIVHVHGNSALMLLDILPAKMANIPIRIVHSHNTTCSHMKVHKILLPIFKKCYTHAYACGRDAGKWLFGTEQFVELKNGIDLKKYKFNPSIRDQHRKKINAGSRVVIGHIGNFIEQKNHTFLLDWYAELIKEDTNYLLLLISDGVLMELMKKKVHQLGIGNNVLFLGKTTEVQNYLQAMDIFVLPSLHEGLPVVLVEAQASGLPCVVADTVSQEADITGSLKFLPITDRKTWVKTIKDFVKLQYNRGEKSIEWQKKISIAGYDITQNANTMRKLYINYINKDSI